ncbi:T9SS type A sorting domain-containing protein, partial [bacterium]|nr:T9SS type A sorting domain-containing protein [bacterium]
GWAADSLSWTGSFVITDSTGDGLNTIAVSGARDIWGWTMETDTAYTLFIDTQPPGSQASSPAISPADTFLVSWTTDDPLPSSGIAGVTVYVSENDSDWVAWLSDATDTCALYPGQDEHTYFFYAVATDSAGNAEDTAAAAECTTYVDASAPLVPAMLLPADGAVVADTLPIFTWSPVTKAGGKTTTGRTNRRGGETEGTPVEYHLQCAVDDLFDSLLVDQESLTDTSYTPDAFNDGLYYWRVAASDGAGHNSGFPAAPFSFQVDTQPPVITGTTVWPDTSFPGPFPVTADITDGSDIALVLLWYRTSLDTVPQADTMEVAGKGVYTGQIPELVESGLIQVEYYIDAHDAASPANIGTDPPNAPEDSVYSFWATVVSVEEELSGEIPKTFALDQNYPNPFNAQTTIEYTVSRPGHVSLKVFNATGQLVRTLVNDYRPINRYALTWDGTDEGGRPVASGMYFCQLLAGEYNQTMKMSLLR